MKDVEAMEIRTGTPADLAALTAVEAACFPPAEAATEAELAERLSAYGGHFWLLWDGETLAGFVDGMVTDQPHLTDQMYQDAGLHREDGRWQMIFGVNTLPGLPAAGVCGGAAPAGHRRRQRAGSAGPSAHLQGAPAPLLCQVRLCQPGPLPLRPRRRGLV